MRWMILSFAAVTLAAAPAFAGQPPGPQQPVNAELIRLHDDLRLTDAQERAWRDYTFAVAPSPDMLARHRATTELLPLVPTPRRLALIEATMLQDSLDFKRQATAIKAFYDQLTPDQQKAFDRDTVPPMGADGRTDSRR